MKARTTAMNKPARPTRSSCLEKADVFEALGALQRGDERPVAGYARELAETERFLESLFEKGAIECAKDEALAALFRNQAGFTWHSPTVLAAQAAPSGGLALSGSSEEGLLTHCSGSGSIP
jgi:hypothetical protein